MVPDRYPAQQMKVEQLELSLGEQNTAVDELKGALIREKATAEKRVHDLDWLR